MAEELILVIDDNALNLKMIAYLLTTKGYKVKTAANAKEALIRLTEEKPHLILLDIQLPGMNGLEFARLLKSDANYQSIPVIAITAFALKGDKEKALAAGCDGYIAKPIDIRTLPDIISGYLHTTKEG